MEKIRIAEPMNAEQFANLLYGLPKDKIVEFGLERSYYEDENRPLETYDVECWYFIKRMYIEGYDSEFFLCDYAGGGQAYAIPWDAGCWDESDMKSEVDCLFSHLCDCNGFKVDEVYVDMGEKNYA